MILCLELSAVVLLVKLILRSNLNANNVPIHLWTDSTVTLTWIKGHPLRWKDFAWNRVLFSQELACTFALTLRLGEKESGWFSVARSPATMPFTKAIMMLRPPMATKALRCMALFHTVFESEIDLEEWSKLRYYHSNARFRNLGPDSSILDTHATFAHHRVVHACHSTIQKK